MLGSGSDSSDRFADGVFLGWRRREHLKFESSRIFPLPKGSLEFWIKFDWGQDLNTSTDCNLLNGFFPIEGDLFGNPRISGPEITEIPAAPPSGGVFFCRIESAR